MKYTVAPSQYKGTVNAPPSKSFLQRAVLLAALAYGESVIKGYAPNEDTEVLLKAAMELGASVIITGSEIRINGCGVPERDLCFYCNESGLAARMLSAISLITERKVIVTGSGSLAGRPMNMVCDTLSAAGKKVSSNNGCLPLEITGKVKPGVLHTNASQTSQFLTGLLLVLPVSGLKNEIIVSELKSKPYVELSIEILDKFGLRVENENFSRFVINGGQIPLPVKIDAEGDWSGAAFHLAGGAVAGDVEVTGLSTKSRQADRAVMNVLKQCGASITTEENSVRVKKNNLLPFVFDASDCPDLFPPLALIAANCKGVSAIKGVGRLFYKESNRAEAIVSEFEKMGIKVTFTDDTMFVNGGPVTGGVTVNSHNDHRMAMTLAVLALCSDKPVTIEGMECIRKSYPGFIMDFEKLSG